MNKARGGDGSPAKLFQILKDGAVKVLHLKFNIQKTKIMASGLITSWQIDGEKMETVTDFVFLSSKIILDGDCSHESKSYLSLGRKALTNLDNVLKSRDITLPTKVHIVKVMIFFQQSCMDMKTGNELFDAYEQQIIDAFKLWCWRKLLRVPLDSTEIKPVNPKENQP